LEHILAKTGPDLVISSLTGGFSHQINAHKRIAEYLAESGGRCIFLSTANVFDGSPDSSHTEADAPYPASEYGKFKYSCEKLLQSRLGNHCLIVRLPKILSPEAADNEIRWVKNGGIVHSNLYMSYNSAENAAKAIRFCIETEKSGVVHLTSPDFMAYDEFINALLLKREQEFSYNKDLLTVAKYCGILDCDDPSLIRCGGDGNFYLSLKSIDTDTAGKFSLSCKDVVSMI